jgi:hypothetical protein
MCYWTDNKWFPWSFCIIDNQKARNHTWRRLDSNLHKKSLNRIHIVHVGSYQCKSCIISSCNTKCSSQDLFCTEYTPKEIRRSIANIHQRTINRYNFRYWHNIRWGSLKGKSCLYRNRNIRMSMKYYRNIFLKFRSTLNIKRCKPDNYLEFQL